METKITLLPTEAMQQGQQEAPVFLRQGSKIVAGHEGVFVEDKVILAKAADELAKANREITTLRQQVTALEARNKELAEALEAEVKYLKNSEAVLANNVGKLYSELNEIQKELHTIATNISMVVKPKEGMTLTKIKGE
jgi:predicted  nucleic acid-binding Zn-ribbon protein